MFGLSPYLRRPLSFSCIHFHRPRFISVPTETSTCNGKAEVSHSVYLRTYGDLAPSLSVIALSRGLSPYLRRPPIECHPRRNRRRFISVPTETSLKSAPLSTMDSVYLRTYGDLSRLPHTR
ncbi:hypothetical protein XNC1_3725 [Xenorhabdus nematophila ATCC 19061]|uniref:Uncharacterized protein n=1 Tax=Xenorhabdus nematophila (strain ATCC 19061 / DSM 3370 / CCUG 14189 / LMG 1036 / NCIMB 9965 / AN6) TaxID=406817 RepID=D3VAY1_XENNA|nr:hypothetical protein XNC1_3725 [Xenorhabdus nematophila ATCC 19061]